MSKYQAGQTVQVFQHTDWGEAFNHVVPVGACCEVHPLKMQEYNDRTFVKYGHSIWAVLNSDIVLHESSTNYKPEPRTYTAEEVKALSERAWDCGSAYEWNCEHGLRQDYANFDSFWQANKPQ